MGVNCTAPILARDDVSAPGKRCVIPTMTMVKKIAILAVKAVFIMVVSIPEATPRSWAGTEFIMDALLGEPNIPVPKPMKKRAKANSM